MQMFINNKLLTPSLREGIAKLIQLARQASNITIIIHASGADYPVDGQFLKHIEIPKLDNEPPIAANPNLNHLRGKNG